MNILSLFDGMSCGQIALDELKIPIDNYFSSEIDKFSIQITQKNYPNTIQVGDVIELKGSDLPKIDLLMGGSPCQGFSYAGKQLNFNDPRSKLFFEFVRLLKETNPKYFLLENVKMKKEYEDIITKYMGVEPIKINSSLLSAQSRPRLYWTNIPGIQQPKDKNISFNSILEDTVEEKYYYSEKAIPYLDRNPINRRFINYSDTEKGNCLTTVYSKGMPYNVYVNLDKKYCKDISYVELCSPNGIFKNTHIRRLTPLECERLQTVPKNYTEGASNNQRWKMLGNGWTVDVIKHIFSYMEI
jgi:site-specific DNA-cytosine methylase